jgi:hypothetical protein
MVFQGFYLSNFLELLEVSPRFWDILLELLVNTNADHIYGFHVSSSRETCGCKCFQWIDSLGMSSLGICY